MTIINQPIRIFVINLKSSIERRTEMCKLMDLRNLKYEFFDAVDGGKLNAKIKNEIKNQPYSFKKAFGREMTLGEIGCAMSHLNLYKKIADEQVKCALILEDDIDFDEQLYKIINSNKTIEILNELDLVLLGYSGDGINYRIGAEVSLFKKRRVDRNITFCIPTAWNWSTIGYLISCSGAKKLLKQGSLPRMPADFLTANSPKYNVKLGVSNKPIVWPGTQNQFSHIGGGRGHKDELVNLEASSENKSIPFTKQIYISARIWYHKVKIKINKTIIKVVPKQYLYVSEKF